MSDRLYYSVRTGKNQNTGKLDLPMLLRLFRTEYEGFMDKGYFREALGVHRWNEEYEYSGGTLPWDIEAFLYRKIRKTELWPVERKFWNYSEEDLFDIIEFLYDYISKPVPKSDEYGHRNQEEFDQETAHLEFRVKINELLKDYESISENIYALSEAGEIIVMADSGLENLLEAPIPNYDPDNVDSKVETAVHKFRSFRSSLEDRRDAVRVLVDVLEFLKPKLQEILSSSDEKDLFHLANRFGLRHHNDQQKINYDKAIWYSWMFYYYLATIHASIRLIQKKEKEAINF